MRTHLTVLFVEGGKERGGRGRKESAAAVVGGGGHFPGEPQVELRYWFIRNGLRRFKN